MIIKRNPDYYEIVSFDTKMEAINLEEVKWILVFKFKIPLEIVICILQDLNFRNISFIPENVY